MVVVSVPFAVSSGSGTAKAAADDGSSMVADVSIENAQQGAILGKVTTTTTTRRRRSLTATAASPTDDGLRHRHRLRDRVRRRRRSITNCVSFLPLKPPHEQGSSVIIMLTGVPFFLLPVSVLPVRFRCTARLSLGTTVREGRGRRARTREGCWLTPWRRYGGKNSSKIGGSPGSHGWDKRP
jgi:hypothetical protein